MSLCRRCFRKSWFSISRRGGWNNYQLYQYSSNIQLVRRSYLQNQFRSRIWTPESIMHYKLLFWLHLYILLAEIYHQISHPCINQSGPLRQNLILILQSNMRLNKSLRDQNSYLLLIPSSSNQTCRTESRLTCNATTSQCICGDSCLTGCFESTELQEMKCTACRRVVGHVSTTFRWKPESLKTWCSLIIRVYRSRSYGMLCLNFPDITMSMSWLEHDL